MPLAIRCATPTASTAAGTVTCCPVQQEELLPRALEHSHPRLVCNALQQPLQWLAQQRQVTAPADEGDSRHAISVAPGIGLKRSKASVACTTKVWVIQHEIVIERSGFHGLEDNPSRLLCNATHHTNLVELTSLTACNEK